MPISAASPPASPSPPPPAPPKAGEAAASSTPPPPPPTGTLEDVGTVRRDSVAADRWTVRGTAKVTGDARVREARFDGNVSIGGKLTAGGVTSRGALELGGPVDVTGRFETDGSLRAPSAVHAVDAELRGDSEVLGAVAIDRVLTVRGELRAPSLAVGALTLHGVANVPGEVTAFSVSARFTDDSSLGPVKAKTVEIRARLPNLVERFLPGRDRQFRVERVEADSVELEGVDVEFVRSPAISLGREAHITQYEGTIVRRHPTSRVGFESRSPRPYGLSR